MMKKDNLLIKKLRESQYRDIIKLLDEESVYCELEYLRDRSSFAGVALKISSDKNKFSSNEVCEKKNKRIK